MRITALTVSVLGLLIGGIGLIIAADDGNNEAVKKERRLYEGTWRVTAIEAEGTGMSKEDCATITVWNELDGKWTVKLGGEVIWKGVSSMDPTKTPKTIDFRPTEGADVGKTYFGIYEISRETRRLCYAEAGKERPTEFSAEKGSGHVLVTFKRERSIVLLPK
jgi:uncharacterized protein (TIGR03067 family)